jgi:hypothetical protein
MCSMYVGMYAREAPIKPYVQYVCVYVWVLVPQDSYLCVCTYACVYVCMYGRLSESMYICECMCDFYASVYVCRYVPVRKCLRVCVCVCARANVMFGFTGAC